jgi:hypothetical protein
MPDSIRGAGDVPCAAGTPLPLALLSHCVDGVHTSTGRVVSDATVRGAVSEAFRGRGFPFPDVTGRAMRLRSLVVGGRHRRSR